MLIKGWHFEKEKSRDSTKGKDRLANDKSFGNNRSTIKQNIEEGCKILGITLEKDNIQDGQLPSKLTNKKESKEQEKENYCSSKTLKNVSSSDRLLGNIKGKDYLQQHDTKSDIPSTKARYSKSPISRNQKIKECQSTKYGKELMFCKQQDLFTENSNQSRDRFQSETTLRMQTDGSERQNYLSKQSENVSRLTTEGYERLFDHISKSKTQLQIQEPLEEFDTCKVERYSSEKLNKNSNNFKNHKDEAELEEINEVGWKYRAETLEEMFKVQKGQYETNLKKFKEQVRELKKDQAEQQQKEELDRNLLLDKIRDLQKQLKDKDQFIQGLQHRETNTLLKEKLLIEKEKNIKEKETILEERELKLESTEKTMNEFEQALIKKENTLKNKESQYKNKEVFILEKEKKQYDHQILLESKEKNFEKERNNYQQEIIKVISILSEMLKLLPNELNKCPLNEIKQLVSNAISYSTSDLQSTQQSNTNNAENQENQTSSQIPPKEHEITFYGSQLFKEDESIKWSVALCNQDEICTPLESNIKEPNENLTNYQIEVAKQLVFESDQESYYSNKDDTSTFLDVVEATFDFNAQQVRIAHQQLMKQYFLRIRIQQQRKEITLKLSQKMIMDGGQEQWEIEWDIFLPIMLQNVAANSELLKQFCVCVYLEINYECKVVLKYYSYSFQTENAKINIRSL